MSVNNLTYSSNGLALTESFEGLKLEAYRDVGGVPTIGYGHTGPHVFMGQVITQQQAEAFLVQDVAASTQCVNKYITIALTQNQFDALVDFVFNVGSGNFSNSSLLRYINSGKMNQVGAEFVKWDRVGGKDNIGLLRRRQAENALFFRTPGGGLG